MQRVMNNNERILVNRLLPILHFFDKRKTDL
jgi:hypothetical protein